MHRTKNNFHSIGLFLFILLGVSQPSFSMDDQPLHEMREDIQDLRVLLSRLPSATLEEKLLALKNHMLNNEQLKQELKVYIPHLAANSPSDPEPFDLYEATDGKDNSFLVSDKKVLVIKGPSGAGKTTFTQFLHFKLWKAWQPGQPVPLRIALGPLENPLKNLMREGLGRLGFDETDILKLQQEHKLILLLDGYDETGLQKNLWLNNRL